ncbi:MAG TPA: GDP-L-fucose synthase [Bacteroides sp.]|nr:GDP-L-fucose synthase [Bacteroides sp.]
MNNDSKIYVAGHTGLVGSSLIRGLERHGFTNIMTRDFPGVNLVSQQETDDLFAEEKPEYVLLAAARVGGIMANNTYRADFIYDNIQIQNNIIHACWKHGVKKLLFLGSSCIYPKEAPQPLREDYLLTSELEYTNEPYAIAKIAGIKMCESFNIQHGTNFISVMPTNMYGTGDNYNLETSHVFPALIRKFHLGKCMENNDLESVKEDLNKRPVKGISGDNSENEIIEVLGKFGITKDDSGVTITLWGTGNPLREFLYTDDLADACIFLMDNVDFKDLYDPETKEIKNTHINIGTGKDISIKDLAELISELIGYKGKINWNSSYPDGTFKKQMEVSKINGLGWQPKISLKEGIDKTYGIYTS